MGAIWKWRFEEDVGAEWVAGFCKSELGYGHVPVQVAPRECAEQSEEQYELYVCDVFIFLSQSPSPTHPLFQPLIYHDGGNADLPF